MNRKLIRTTLAGIVGAIAISGAVVVTGANVPNTEVPTAGAAVELNHYLTNSEKVQADLLGILNTPVQPAAVQETQAQAEPAQPASVYDNVAISQVNDYVNVRSGAGTEYEVVGKIYNNCAATILSEENGWYQIQSGNVTGYINSQYFLVGDAAEAKAIEIGFVNATVNTMTLNVRESQSTDSPIVAQLPEGEVYDVIQYGDGWVYLNVDSSTTGWVSMDYVTIDVDFDTAVTLEEEQAMLAEQERLAAEAAAAEAAAKKATTASKSRTTTTTTAAATNSAGTVDTSDKAALRAAVVAYAMQFQGNPYVWGGSSLTNGTDCSGFTMSVYAHFGYSLPHYSGAQAGVGIAVSFDSLLPGDIICYSGHVALYIGNGQIIHASTPSTGIIVSSNLYYRTPIAARRLIY
ncbi:C40 family peptidase [Parasporobacterium paucivorans]|uniref:Cell wall-associated hydrolase, NlpC family n=1 Tax=Parasporobacterium paucivorans DSM 15970 TaxID=1122934 RepID=A0A1M6LDZ6_9FIRM|nr:C40 family peptidase [Parasporobacterium paucivorans]SHJ69396.1 Cell wall-associated hydrolase, NlpC family [Parasporobacterium paucivorans DSM 15970]